jgi:hypothetical protein
MTSLPRVVRACVAVVLITVPGGLVQAQGAPTAPTPPPAAEAAPAPAPPREPLTPLRVQLVLTRMMGEKKISSLPYSLSVNANSGQATSLRMAIEVPVRMGTGTSYSYKSLGTNIDCLAAKAEGAFTLFITVSDTSVQFDTGALRPVGDAGAAAPTPGPFDAAPAFRTFTSKSNILLKDGQTASYTAATDPISGETLSVEATLSVLK